MADPMDHLRIGIAGYGVIGKRRRGCVDANPFMKTVAVCDKKFADDGQLDDGVAYSRDYQKLFDHNLDAVLVCMRPRKPRNNNRSQRVKTKLRHEDHCPP